MKKLKFLKDNSINFKRRHRFYALCFNSLKDATHITIIAGLKGWLEIAVPFSIITLNLNHLLPLTK